MIQYDLICYLRLFTDAIVPLGEQVFEKLFVAKSGLL